MPEGLHRADSLSIFVVESLAKPTRRASERLLGIRQKATRSRVGLVFAQHQNASASESRA